MQHLQSGAPAVGDGLRARATAWFSVSAGVIFLATGGAKIISAFGLARVLDAGAPLTGLTNRTLLIWVGVGELALAAACLYPKTRGASVSWVAGTSTLFLLFRLGLWLVGWEGPCGCLGNLTGALGVSVEAAERATELLLAYLLVGSYAVLAWRVRAQRNA